MKTSTQISVSDFNEIASENEYWLLYMLSSRFTDYAEIQPLSRETKSPHGVHIFREIMNNIDIPVYEITDQEGLDFIMYLDNKILSFYKNKANKIYPDIILGFNYAKLVKSTVETCLCDSGIIKVIGTMNPNLLLNLVDN